MTARQCHLKLGSPDVETSGMNEAGAGEALGRELVHLRSVGYQALLAMLGKPAHYRSAPVDGQVYNVERQVLWDSTLPPPRGDGNLRVLVSVDDVGVSAFRPLTGDFIIAPDGRFVGE
jgi:hypothetical protein